MDSQASLVPFPSWHRKGHNLCNASMNLKNRHGVDLVTAGAACVSKLDFASLHLLAEQRFA